MLSWREFTKLFVACPRKNIWPMSCLTQFPCGLRFSHLLRMQCDAQNTLGIPYLMMWTHTTSPVSRILHWRSSGWRNVFGYGCVLLLLWGWRLLILGNCFAMGLRVITTASLSESWNSRNKSLLIASIILSQQTQGVSKIIYLPLMTLIMKALCIPVGESTIPVLLLAIQRSARDWIPQ